ncbi:hypothetical protein A3Q34_08495 [Colwellia sp. PAMC 20917]|uniref:hypothetical protein n=1 Tax=Colwellia sp. PAMC 20917 TaxID=1816218 RepID=UPI000878954A|nr:hypothetical protein [Colwellia sp. PAMC 20917]AOW76889.1 hypothetical protein A3Q34_08495 [Colwellia sp. PAMC 20917]
MSTVLSISNKIFSLKGQMFIDDENGERCYEAKGEFALFCPIWTLKNSVKDLATVKRKLWSWSPTWNVESTIGDFIIKRKLFSWTRAYNVAGGLYDGAVIKGNVWDLKFEISYKDECIASAKSKILSLRDTHNILVHETNNDAELFTTIIMVALHLDQKDDKNDSGSSD